MPILITPFFYLIQKIYNGSIIVSFLHDPKRDYRYLQIVLKLSFLDSVLYHGERETGQNLFCHFMRLSTMNKVPFSYAV